MNISLPQQFTLTKSVGVSLNVKKKWYFSLPGSAGKSKIKSNKLLLVKIIVLYHLFKFTPVLQTVLTNLLFLSGKEWNPCLAMTSPTKF